MIKSQDISVVIQGAINKKITPSELKSIRKYLPNAEIILSTWEENDVAELDYDILVLNKDPGGTRHDFTAYNKSRSMNNFNRQLVSTQNGISKATRKYILKLRSDLVLKNSNFLDYWDKFSMRNENYSIFNHRVLCSCLYSRENSCQSGWGYPTPFHPSDFWFFGERGDILNYFDNCKIQTKEEAGNWDFKYPNRCPYSIALWRYAPEQQFCISWAKKYYPDIKFEDWSDWNEENIELSNNILYNNFIFLGFEQSGIYSEKHAYAESIKNSIQGLITYKHFMTQYKNYCDETFIIKKDITDYEYKLKTHYERFLRPFLEFKSWLSEVFSVTYYSIVLLLKKICGDKNNDIK